MQGDANDDGVVDVADVTVIVSAIFDENAQINFDNADANADGVIDLTDNTPLQILRDNDKRLTLTANRIPLSQWFSEQYDKLRQSIRQPIQPKKSRGMKI